MKPGCPHVQREILLGLYRVQCPSTLQPWEKCESRSAWLFLYSLLASSPGAVFVNNGNPQTTFLLEGRVTSVEGILQRPGSSSVWAMNTVAGPPGLSKATPRFSASLSDSVGKVEAALFWRLLTFDSEGLQQKASLWLQAQAMSSCPL